MVIRSVDGASRDGGAGDVYDEDRGARHTSATTSSVRSGHARNHSGTSSNYSSRGSPNGRIAPPSTWRDAFVNLQSELGPEPSSASMKVALLKFLKDLPPFYATAAADFVQTRRDKNLIVNLDALGQYFAVLDQTSVQACQLPKPTPPPRSCSSRSPMSKRSPSFSIKASPKSPTSPRASRINHKTGGDDHFVDFAPSRPHVSNLLLSEGIADDDRRSQSR